MTFDDAVRNRRSVRGFLPVRVPDAILRESLELAQLAPSNCNAQPWVVHAVSGDSLTRLRQDLVDAAKAGQPANPDFPADVRRFTGIHRERQIDAAVQLYGAMGIARNDVSGRKWAYLRNYACFDAPHVVFVFIEAQFGPREIHDLGMYGQTLLLALAARGIASCMQGALGEYPDIVRQHLGIGPQFMLMHGISIGYEDPQAKANGARVGRVPIGEAVHFHD